MILGEPSEIAKVVYGDASPSTLSLWHCLELCRQYDDCVWVSWKTALVGHNKDLDSGNETVYYKLSSASKTLNS